MLRDWLLSKQCQLTAQTVVGVLIAALFTVVRPLRFSYACLAPVFVIIIVTSLAQDQHVGSRMQVTAMLLGPTWLAVALATALMTLAKLAEITSEPYAPGYVVAATLLALLGLAVLVLLRSAAPAGPAPLMGVLSTVVYGIIVILSVRHHGILAALQASIAPVLLAVLVGCAASLLAGFAITPSLASDEVIRLTAEVLRGSGAILSHHTSVLMAEHQRPGTTSKQHVAATSSTTDASPTCTAVRMSPTHTVPAAATGRPLILSLDTADGAAAAAAAAAAHKAAAGEHDHATLDWVLTEPQGVPGTQLALGSSSNSNASAKSIASVGSNRKDAELSNLDGMDAGNNVEENPANGIQATRDIALEQSQRLDAVLLEAVDAAAGAQQNGLIRENMTAVWVAAAATASRQGSLLLDTGAVAHGPLVAAQLASAGSVEPPQARTSLELAASITFLPEADDQTFLQAMRTLSRSKPYGSTTALQQLVQQQGNKSQQLTSYEKSAASVESNAGSNPDDPDVPAVSVGAGEAWRNAGEDYTRWHTGAGHVTWADADGSTTAAHVSSAKPANSHSPGSGDSTPAKHNQRYWGLHMVALQHYMAGSLARLGMKPPHSQAQQKPEQQRSRPLVPHSISWVDLANTPAVGSTAAVEPVQTAAQHMHATAPGSSILRDEGSPAEPLQQLPPCAAAHWNQAAPVTAAALGLLIGKAKTLVAAARIEPGWLRPMGLNGFDADAWAALLEDTELLLVRVSTLEALSDERRLQGLQLDQLQHYRNIADAMSMTLAQLAAFLAHVAEALKQQQASHHVHPFLARLLCLCRPCSKHQKDKHTQNQQPSTTRQLPVQQRQSSLAAPGRGSSPSPFAAAACAKTPTDDAASASQDVVSWSAVLSGLERQGSGVSSYLWEKKAGWETGRQLLQREMEAAVGGYWWAVRRASKKAPVQVPGSREVMTLTFIWPITNGLLDALERVEESAQRVLSSTKSANTQQGEQGSRDPPAALSGNKQLSWLGRLVPSWRKQDQQSSSVHNKWQSQPQHSFQCPACWCSLLASTRAQLQQQQKWVRPLVTLLTVQPGLQTIKQAVLQDLPAALRSKKGLYTLLSSRTFQAGMKLYFAAGSTLILTMVLMVYLPSVRQVAPIFSFTTVCLSMQERVEATADKVVGRVLGTVAGATIGLAITQVPNIISSPVLLLACIGVACMPLSIMAQAGARVAVALALLTLLAVSLCTYEMVCCTPGPHMGAVGIFAARLGSVVGACVYVALLNRLILPWYTADYALEQMADALGQAAVLFESIYLSQYNRMRVAAVAAGVLAEGADAHATPHTANPTFGLATVAAIRGSVSQQVSMQDAPAAAPNTAATFHPIRISLHRRRSFDVMSGRAAAPAGVDQAAPSPLESAAAELAALEAAEAGLHVALRQEVLSRLVNVQLLLAKESVSWKRGMLATPQVVFDVLGAMLELVEALACQRLALAPFTRQGASATVTGAAGPPGSTAAVSMPGGLLRVSGHCFKVWAEPLHPLWLELLAAVQDLTRATVHQLRATAKEHATSDSSRHDLLARLSHLEAARLELRRGWLAIRTNLHKHVHAGAEAPARATELCRLPAGVRFWPIDSVHFFTFTYGASRVLNKLAGVTQTLLAA